MAEETSEEATLFQPRICVWESLTYVDATALLKADSNYDVMDYLTSMFKISKQNASRRELITLDLHYYAVQFARKHKFKPEQMSALYSIIESIHRLCISTPYDNTQQCFQLFQDLLVCHSVNRSPYSTQIYSLDQVKLITNYILLSYFKHFKMYKYAFTKKVQLELQLGYHGIPETPLPSQTHLVEEGTESGEEEEGQGKTDETGEPDKDDEGGDEHDETLSPQEKQLKDLIAQTLNLHVQNLKSAVEMELSASDKRITEKLSSLEGELDKKKKSK